MPSDLEHVHDTQLLVLVAAGGQDALAEVFRRYAGAVHGLARRLVTDAALAEEVTQEVFLRIWRAPERYDPSRGSLRSYLLAQCHGRSIDLVRSETARRRREEREGARQPPEPPSTVEQEVMGDAVASEVRAALDGLPEAERRPIELAYFGGHTYREVAEMLGEPEGTIKSRIRKGLGRMRADLRPVHGGGS